MKIVAPDTTHYQALVDTLERMLQHRRGLPTTQADELYYKLLLDYYRRPLHAQQEGKKLVAHAAYIPPEVFHALDIVPLNLESWCIVFSSVLKDFEGLASVAKGYGLPPEVCSAHRVQAALFLKGWLPRPDAVVWSQQICDSISHSGHLLKEVYGLPGFYVDRPYGYDDKAVKYYAQEMGGMVAFLEDLAGRRMDWDRLLEALAQSQEISRLQGQINSLTRAIPSPAPNRLGVQLQVINWLGLGTREGVAFCQNRREELQDRVERGKGYYPRERHRLISLFPPPAFRWKLLDWMGREHGASIVAEPYAYHWGPWEVDPRQPLETLARRCFAVPTSRHYHGAINYSMVPDAVEDALSHHCQGAIYFAMINCRQGAAMVRTVKDALREKAGIPTLVVDIDVLDPTFVTDDELKDKIEGFLETLEEGR